MKKRTKFSDASSMNVFSNLKYMQERTSRAIIVFLVLHVSICPSVNSLISQCPEVLTYEDIKPPSTKYDGSIQLLKRNCGRQGLNGFKIDIEMDRSIELFGNDLASVTTADNLHFSINSETVIRCLKKQPIVLKFFVKFESGLDSIPRIINIMLNNSTICAPSGTPETTPIINTVPSKDRVNTNPSTQNGANDVECGRVAVQPLSLILKGRPTIKGQWPWHVSLYHVTTGSLSYKCGGSLISRKVMITAAHCVVIASQPVDPKSLHVILGKYYLNNWTEDSGIQRREISKVVANPGYTYLGLRNDIAILEFVTPVDYTLYVRPVCLWEQTKTHIYHVEGKIGTVAGWGFDETSQPTNELQMVDMPVVSTTKCLENNRTFFGQYLRETNYCAGYLDGTSPCNGDSGGGMHFPRKQADNSNKWYLRGIVSSSVPRLLGNSIKAVCDPNYYVIFTDVAKYLSWISEVTTVT